MLVAMFARIHRPKRSLLSEVKGSIPLLRSSLLSLLLLPVLFLMACGDGLSGQATGQNAQDLEGLQEDLAYYAEAMADFGESRRDFALMVDSALLEVESLANQMNELDSATGLGGTAADRLQESRYALSNAESAIAELVVQRDAVIGDVLDNIKNDIMLLLPQADGQAGPGPQSNDDMDMLMRELDRQDQDLADRIMTELIQIEADIDTLVAELLEPVAPPLDVDPEAVDPLPEANWMESPQAYIGFVLDADGQAAPVGTPVEAWLPGYQPALASTTVSGDQGTGSYTLVVPQHGTLLQSGYTTIEFYVGGVNTGETAVWETGGGTLLDLPNTGSPFSPPSADTPSTPLPVLPVEMRENPPFSGTLYFGHDFITADDPSYFLELEERPAGPRRMYDRRAGWVDLTPHIYLATFSDGLVIEVQFNPEFENADLRLELGNRYLRTIGQLPTELRADVETVWIHDGDEDFGGGNFNLLIHTGRAFAYEDQGILEEVFLHEAAHTSLDAYHKDSPGWLTAQSNDGQFISDYARDNPYREDIAESFPMYYAVRYKSSDIPTSTLATIVSTMPNRIQYFDNYLPITNPADQSCQPESVSSGPTGVEVPGMYSFDAEITSLMDSWDIPGASVAVAKDGRLVFARGYGLADVECEISAQPDSLFRVASISKPITRSAILNLISEGSLSLDSLAIDYLDSILEDTDLTDDRIEDITIDHLLEHTGGWDIDLLGFDPMFHSNQIAWANDLDGPASCEDVIRFMYSEYELASSPGTEYAYSNLGYCILGRIIEAVSGDSYEDYVTESLLEPIDITRMALGATLEEGRQDDEVRYYHYDETRLANSVFPWTLDEVQWPYGGFNLEAMDSAAGWIASTVDLVRFAKDVRPLPYSGDWWFEGSLDGIRGRLVSSDDGSLIMALLLNSRASYPSSDAELGRSIETALDSAKDNVLEWPSHDLFQSFR